MLHSYTLKNDKKAKGIRFVLFLFMVVIQATAFAQGGMKITIQKENITVIVFITIEQPKLIRNIRV